MWFRWLLPSVWWSVRPEEVFQLRWQDRGSLRLRRTLFSRWSPGAELESQWNCWRCCPWKNHESTHVVSEVLFRIVSDLMSKIKCRLWPILVECRVLLSNQRIARAQPALQKLSRDWSVETCSSTWTRRLTRFSDTRICSRLAFAFSTVYTFKWEGEGGGEGGGRGGNLAINQTKKITIWFCSAPFQSVRVSVILCTCITSSNT